MSSSIVNEFAVYRSLTLHINGQFVFVHAPEASSINIHTDTDTHTTDRPLHTHTHTQTHKHYTLQIWSFSNMPLFRGLMKIDRLLRSTWEDIICIITLYLGFKLYSTQSFLYCICCDICDMFKYVKDVYRYEIA